MHIAKHGEYYSASRVTGPRHNTLELLLVNGSSVEVPTVEFITSPACGHNELNASEVLRWILQGVAEANARHHSEFSVKAARFSPNDTAPEITYGYLASQIVDYVASGGHDEGE